MADYSTGSAIVGAVVGIAFVVFIVYSFPYSADSINRSNMSQIESTFRTSLLDITIESPNRYTVGDNLDVIVHVGGYTTDCHSLPSAEMTDTDDKVIWEAAEAFNLCVTGDAPHRVDIEWNLSKTILRSGSEASGLYDEINPLSITKAGTYIVSIALGETTIEKEIVAIPAVSQIIISEGAANPSQVMNFDPSVINVTIGVNNTVRWTNQDSVPSSIVADNDGDPDFFNATQNDSGSFTHESNLFPGESFEYTFDKPGVFGYHSVPHPWMRGTVVVLP